MDLQIQKTEDGSHTLYWGEKNEHYHSTHGSIQEARKVYLESAFEPAIKGCRQQNLPMLRIFEMGFGTGLNAFLTLSEAERLEQAVEYTSLEANPIPEKIWKQLNYPQITGFSDTSVFEKIHLQAFDGKAYPITPFFTLIKIKGDMRETRLPESRFQAIYYDAFAPSVQPELWEKTIFEKLRKSAASFCFLSTYCAQGQFRRNLKASGFTVESLPGPAGKREITRGVVGIEPEIEISAGSPGNQI